MWSWWLVRQRRGQDPLSCTGLWSRLITAWWCQTHQSYTGCRCCHTPETMLASTHFVWSKPYQRSSRVDAHNRKSDQDGVGKLCPIYSDPFDIENCQIYDTINKSIVDKPPVPKIQRMPLKDKSNTNHSSPKSMSKKRSKSLSGFSNKKVCSNNESGKRNLFYWFLLIITVTCDAILLV